MLTLRKFLQDVALWGWAERRPAPAVSHRRAPGAPSPAPGPSPPNVDAPNVDAALTAEVALLEDPFARCAITLLRQAGLRLGEVLDLELGCVVNYGPAGTWLRAPLGKLGTERPVPVDGSTVALLDAWAEEGGRTRPHPHPRTRHSTDFLFVDRATASRPGGSARARTPRSSGPASPVPEEVPSRSPPTSSATPTPPSSPTPG